MNSVKLTGAFAKVSVYTSGAVTVEYSQDWKSYFKDDFNYDFNYIKGTFVIEENDAFVEVRMSYAKFKELEQKHGFTDSVMTIEGKLCTEVNRGIGTVSNYILIE